MQAFTHDAIPGRVVFGAGSRHRLRDELVALGATRVLIVAGERDRGLVADVETQLGALAVGRFRDVVQHVPAERAAAAVERCRDVDADAILTIGGGSATGFGKILRLEVDASFVAVPTTYAGSEMTTIWGRTEGTHKRTGNDPRVKPDTVVYDPELTLDLPARIAGPSGMNALAHCVEALYAPGTNPVVSLFALEGARALATGLPLVCGDGDGLDARSDVLYGAYLAGVALAAAGTALHHRTCHVLGGMFGLDHGAMNAVVLGHALAYNAPALGSTLDDLGAALGVSGPDAPAAIHELAGAIGAPTSLASIGMPADGIDAAAERIVDEATGNIRPPDLEPIIRMLEDAHAGRPPRRFPPTAPDPTAPDAAGVDEEDPG